MRTLKDEEKMRQLVQPFKDLPQYREIKNLELRTITIILDILRIPFFRDLFLKNP